MGPDCYSVELKWCKLGPEGLLWVQKVITQRHESKGMLSGFRWIDMGPEGCKLGPGGPGGLTWVQKGMAWI